MSHNIMFHCTTCGVTSAPIENFHVSTGIDRAYAMLKDRDLILGLYMLSKANIETPLEDLGPAYQAMLTVAPCAAKGHEVVPCADYGARFGETGTPSSSCFCSHNDCPVRQFASGHDH